MRPVPVGLIAGVASGALLYAGTAGSFGAAILASLAPLPLGYAGLSAGLPAAAIAVAVATVGLLVLTDAGGWWVFPLAFGAPVLVMVQRALLARDGTELGRPGGLVWYPPGLLAVWLAGLAAVLSVVATMLGGADFRAGLVASLEASMAQLGQPAAPDQLEHAAGAFIALLPAGWMAMLAVNLGLAQGLAVRFGHNVRPTPRLAELELPAWFAGAFGAALVLSLLSGEAGQIGAGLAVIAAVAYMLHGLGVVHWWAARARSPRLVLAWVYLLVGIFTPVAAALVVLGLVDTWARFRHRGTRTGTEE